MRKARAGADQLAALFARALEQHAARRAAVAFQRDRARPRADEHAVGLRELALEAARLHVIGAAAIGDRHALGAEALRLHRDVDRGHAAADDDDAAPDRQFGEVLGLPQLGDVVDRVDDVGEFALARQAELVGRAEADAEEHRVIVAPQRLERQVAAERDAVLHLDAADREDEGGLLAAKSSGVL